jgi:SpoVK/Ycf46/Vps4 family AAA+-type ATPase
MAALSHVRPLADASAQFSTRIASTAPIFAGYDAVCSRLRPVFAGLRDDRFSRFHLRPPSGVLLHGPPGCGKASLLAFLAAEAGLPILAAQPAGLLSRYLGQTEANIRALYAAARNAQPCLVLIEGIEALALRRAAAGEDGASTGVGQRALSTLLNEMDGITESGMILTVACTDLPLTSMDAALLRPGRLELHEEVGRPDAADRTAIAKAHLASVVVADDDLHSQISPAAEWLGSVTAGWTGAGIARCCHDALAHHRRRGREGKARDADAELLGLCQALVSERAAASAASFVF